MQNIPAALSSISTVLAIVGVGGGGWGINYLLLWRMQLWQHSGVTK